MMMILVSSASSNLSTTASQNANQTRTRTRTRSASAKISGGDLQPPRSSSSNLCLCCGRRHFTAATTTAHLTLFPLLTSKTDAAASSLSDDDDDPVAVLNRVHPPRPDWYEELYAKAMGMQYFEAEIAAYKLPLFSSLTGKANNILEIGIGTGPNLKYYAKDNGVNVFGVDPNRKMEKYAQAAAYSAGLNSSNFKFFQAVAEALPLNDASMDAVIGTHVLCSVKDVDKALQEVKRVLKPGGLYLFVEHVAAKDGTILKLVQRVLDPLQQIVADGCHLTRETGNNISSAGFSSVDINMGFLASASLISPHTYGIARK